jgi:hypothetical protein
VTFKLPGKPSPKADVHELADFAELIAWKSHSVSAREIVAYLGQVGESESNVGCEDEDDDNMVLLEEVMAEIERRQRACQSGYPFDLDATGNVLRFVPDKSHRALLYLYLLLSTRLNMKKDRIHADIDGANLLEEVSAGVLRAYLGGKRARALVFGTAAGSADFPKKIESLCADLREAYGFRVLDSGPMHANDDKLDVVGWIPFADKSPGQIIVFGQCKTGTAWTERLCNLQPAGFIKKWINGPFMVDPLRAFFVSEAADRSKWGAYCVEGGIFFDRCRLVDCCDALRDPLKTKIAKWNDAAFTAVESGI